MSDKPTIVFAHGLWADGSCYSKVIPLLLADGFQVISTQNHLNTVADDAAAVRTSFARASGPVVLVGHSYGGTVITAAGTDNRVAALVYIYIYARLHRRTVTQRLSTKTSTRPRLFSSTSK